MMRKLKEAKKVDRGLNVHKYQKELKVKMRNFKLLTQLLLSKGANVDQKDNFGATPLMYASQGGVCQMMEILIRDGNADLERKDKYNNTALHYAIAYNQIAAANFLEDNGADALALNDIDETPTDVAGIRKKLLDPNRYDYGKNRNDGDSDYTTTDNDYSSTTDNNYSSSTSTDNRSSKSRPRHPRHRSKLKKIADEVDREEELKQKKKKNSALKEAANEVAREEAGGRNSSRSKKNKSSLKDIAAAISSDEDDYNDDDFEGNDTGTAKPSKPSRPSGAASRPVGGARPTAKKPSTASRPQGRPKGRPSGASRPTRPSRNT